MTGYPGTGSISSICTILMFVLEMDEKKIEKKNGKFEKICGNLKSVEIPGKNGG